MHICEKQLLTDSLRLSQIYLIEMAKPEILIIDDEPQIRKLLEINLESNDYKVRQVATGQEGLFLAANHPPDLILLDIGLADKNGHQILKEL